MDQRSIAVALIRNSEPNQLCWLARQNSQTLQLEFIVGDRLEEESYRETTIREVAWELNLNRQKDFLVSNMAQLNLEFVDQLPGEFSKTHLSVAFYNVEIYKRDIREKLLDDRKNFWVSSSEICEGVTKCGRRFDPIVPYLINRSNVIQSWESQSGN
jgi:hypothetical protein